jgi:hypothetical protein
METVIDAQVVSGYFQETVCEVESRLTERAALVFERVGSEDQVFLDDGGIIEHEWRNVVEPEWFDVWYARLLQEDAAVRVCVNTCHALCRQLERKGFPRGSRDVWYVRTAKAVVDRFGQAIIVTEDMDFYDPTQKKGTAKQRMRILLSGDGQVARHLHRRENIAVKCVASYLDFVCGS